MKTSFTIGLPVHPASAGLARRFVDDALDQWGMAEARDEALLLTTELVTNALLHAGSDTIQLHMKRVGASVRVEVTDVNPMPPQIRQHSALASTGRGLTLIDAAASAWGTKPTPPGKTVWFELETKRA